MKKLSNKEKDRLVKKAIRWIKSKKGKEETKKMSDRLKKIEENDMQAEIEASRREKEFDHIPWYKPPRA